MTLDDVAAIERALRRRMPSAGYLEDRHASLERTGLYDEWRRVFSNYVELALAGDDEALKRALFYLWYQCAEPNALSGLWRLDEQSIERVLRRTDARLRARSLDAEFRFMLPYYAEVCAWYFERFEGLEHVNAASTPQSDEWREAIVLSDWTERGIMGEYWSNKG